VTKIKKDLKEVLLKSDKNVQSAQQNFDNEVRCVRTIDLFAEFQIDGDWAVLYSLYSIHHERMEQYFLINMDPEDRKGSLLITCEGKIALKMLRDLCDPLPPSKQCITLIIVS